MGSNQLIAPFSLTATYRKFPSFENFMAYPSTSTAASALCVSFFTNVMLRYLC